MRWQCRRVSQSAQKVGSCLSGLNPNACDQAEARAGGRVEASSDALEHTRALAATLAADKDGKFANSRFLQFVSKMSRGEIVLEGNEAKAVPATSAAWAREFEESQAAQRVGVHKRHLDLHGVLCCSEVL